MKFLDLVHRFIFLFRWHEDRRSRRKIFENAAELFEKDDEKINSIFFAQQIGEADTNICCKHYLFSIEPKKKNKNDNIADVSYQTFL